MLRGELHRSVAAPDGDEVREIQREVDTGQDSCQQHPGLVGLAALPTQEVLLIAL